MAHPLVLVPRPWSRRDQVNSRRFPRRAATVPRGAWIEELMAKRFGAVILCGACAVAGAAMIHQWGYAKHPDLRSQGGHCDGCQESVALLPIYIAEEKRGRAATTRHELSDERRRRLAPVPERFRA